MTLATSRRRALAALAALATCGMPFLADEARAQDWPSKPITIVVAYPPGGDTDVLARLFAEKLAARVKQTVLVENRSGAAGTIGTAYVAKAPADGHTLLFAPNTVAMAPLVLKAGTGVQYDPVKDLTPIVHVGNQSLFVVANTSTGAASVKDLVASVKAGKVQTYASPGSGSPMHILGSLFNKSAGVQITQVPYRGSAPAVSDMVGGHVPMMYTTLGPVAQHISAGKLVALAVADPQRSPFMPNVPTLQELGYKGADVGAWQALMGPKGMPAEIVKQLNAHINEILKMPDVVARMAGIATTPVGGGADTLGKLVFGDHERYARIVKEFGIQAD